MKINPDLDFILNQLKTKEINHHRQRVACLLQSIAAVPNDFSKRQQLRLSLERLETLLIY